MRAGMGISFHNVQGAQMNNLRDRHAQSLCFSSLILIVMDSSNPALFRLEGVIHDGQAKVDNSNASVQPFILNRNGADPGAGATRDFYGKKHHLKTKWSGQTAHTG